MKAIDLTGQKFGNLTVVERFHGGKISGRGYWICLCKCGNIITPTTGSLRQHNTKSCGKCNRSEAGIVHGYSRRGKRSPTHQAWCHMRQRCSNPKNSRWAHYGGRGIKVCDRWLENFENFLADMGEKPPGTSLDRINVNGNYEPSNCRWATASEQARNKRPYTLPRARKGNKLSPESILAIRACDKAGVHGNAIAVAFQISRAMVSLIINEKCWVRDVI